VFSESVFPIEKYIQRYIQRWTHQCCEKNKNAVQFTIRDIPSDSEDSELEKEHSNDEEETIKATNSTYHIKYIFK